MTDVNTLKDELVTIVEAANDLTTLEAARVQALGKKGKITGLMKTLGGMDPEERKTTGAALNVLKDEIAALIACLLYTSPSPRDRQKSRMPSSA